MASLRELARENIWDAGFGVCWFALWKTGRAWHMERFWPDYDERRNAFKIETCDSERMKEILADDYNAKFINGWYCNIGTMEEMTIETLTDGLRFQYDHGDVMLCDCL